MNETSKAAIWFDPRFGVSGDMMLGALVGLGADPQTIVADLARALPELTGWEIDTESTDRCSIEATRVTVSLDHRPHHHRTWSSIDALLATAALPRFVADGARRTFALLGRAEALIHRIPIDEVHFHEVGAVDALVDIVGSWLALHQLRHPDQQAGQGADRGFTPVGSIQSGPVGLGQGTVAAAHGLLPLPAPATAALLADHPVAGLEVEGETATPTGAALLVSMVDRWGPMPTGLLAATARGAGGRNPSTHPNVLTAHLITPTPPSQDRDRDNSLVSDHGLEHQPAVVLATNLDDASAEVMAHTIARCLEEGADDAWAVPIIMKKGRPATQLNVLCHPDRADHLRVVVMNETGTLGVRTVAADKHLSPRRFETVVVRNEPITIKIGLGGAKPEFDDLVGASRRLGIPLRQLSAEALRTWQDRAGADDGTTAEGGAFL